MFMATPLTRTIRKVFLQLILASTRRMQNAVIGCLGDKRPSGARRRVFLFRTVSRSQEKAKSHSVTQPKPAV